MPTAPPPLSVDLGPGGRAIATLRLWIDQGRLPSGQRLPSEEQLAQDLTVARGTLRTALKRLEAEGLLQGSPHLGRVVVGPRRGTDILVGTIGWISDQHAPTDDPVPIGDELAVDRAVAGGARSAGLHLLQLHADLVDEGSGERLAASGLRGLLVPLPVADAARFTATVRSIARRVPIVVNSSSRAWEDVDRVYADQAQGTYELTTWLLRRGHRRILRLWNGTPRSSWLIDRNRGHERAMTEAGLDVIPPVHLDGLPLRDATDPARHQSRARYYAGHLVDRLAGPRGVDAILATTDCDVFPIATACRLCAREPGPDLPICGYDGYWQHCGEHRFEAFPPSATVIKDNPAVGAGLVRLLLDRVSGRLAPGPQVLIIPPRLTIPDTDPFVP